MTVSIQKAQAWTLREPHRTAIAKGLAWAAETLPAETDLESLVRQAQAKQIDPLESAESQRSSAQDSPAISRVL